MKSFQSRLFPPYKYSPLDSTKHQIRLLHLLPGSITRTPRCKIEIVSLDEQPLYYALSYAWGNSTGRKRVQVDGKAFYVTRNLYEALLQFQSELQRDEKYLLWADAVSQP